MTKRKSPSEFKKRGPKVNRGDDESVWLAVQLRRRRLGWGRRDQGRSVTRAIEFLLADLIRHKSNTGGRAGLRKRFDRTERRRRLDPAYKAYLDDRLPVAEQMPDA
jgi:hypothetical protein